jgi:hypothetical protein
VPVAGEADRWRVIRVEIIGRPREAVQQRVGKGRFERVAVDRRAAQRRHYTITRAAGGDLDGADAGVECEVAVADFVAHGYRSRDRGVAAEVHFPLRGEVADRDRPVARQRAGDERGLAVPDIGGDALHLCGVQVSGVEEDAGRVAAGRIFAERGEALNAGEVGDGHAPKATLSARYKKPGRAAGLRQFGRVAGLRETAPAAATGPGYAWGLTLTSPYDQLRLLELLTHRNALLTDADRQLALRLMEHVETDQRWGVTSGTGNSRVALKNGWLPLYNWTSDWQINSIGAVQGRGGNYLIAVETHGAARMSQGVAIVEQVSRLVARACG